MNKEKVDFYKLSKYFTEIREYKYFTEIGEYKYDKYPHLKLEPTTSKDIYQIYLCDLNEEAYIITDFSTSFDPICRRVLFQSDNIDQCIEEMAHKTNWLLDTLIDKNIKFNVIDSEDLPILLKLHIEDNKKINKILRWLEFPKDELKPIKQLASERMI